MIMFLNRLVKLLPLGTVVIIGLGVLKTSVYYNYFGVDIMSFLSTTEVLTLFLNDLQPLLVLVIVSLIHLIISERFFESVEKGIGSKTFEKYIRDKKWYYFSFFSIVFILLSISLVLQWFKLNTWFIYLYIFTTIQLVVFLFVRKKGEILIKNESFLKLFLIICVFSIIPLISLKNIRLIDNNDGKKIKLILKTEIKVDSSRKNRFLGKAGKYYFFYDPKKKETTIYKSEDVKQIEIKL